MNRKEQRKMDLKAAKRKRTQNIIIAVALAAALGLLLLVNNVNDSSTTNVPHVHTDQCEHDH